MNNSKQTDYFKILVAISGSLFLLLFLILSYHNRFAADDYDNIDMVSKYGIVGGMIYAYTSFCGRWTTYLFWGPIYHFYEIRAVLVAYSFLVIVGFMTALFCLIKVFLHIFSIKKTNGEVVIYSIFFSAFFFFSCFGKGEIWFWVSATANYINSITAFIFVIAIIFSNKKNIVFYPIIILLSTYAGGASETYSVFYIILILIFLIISFYNPFKLPCFSAVSKVKFSIAFIFLLAAFLISYFSPGVKIRTTWLPEKSIMSAFFITFKAMGSMMIFKLLPQIPYLIVFTIPVIGIGRSFNKLKPEKSISNFLKPFIISGVFLVAIIYIFMFPACYLLSESGPDRALSLVILTIVLYFAFWGFYLGYNYKIAESLMHKTQLFSLILIIGLLSYSIITQYSKVKKYSNALDERITYFKSVNFKEKNKVLYLQKLPPSGFLYSAEYKQDSLYIDNDTTGIKIVLLDSRK